MIRKRKEQKMYTSEEENTDRENNPIF